MLRTSFTLEVSDLDVTSEYLRDSQVVPIHPTVGNVLVSRQTISYSSSQTTLNAALETRLQ